MIHNYALKPKLQK